MNFIYAALKEILQLLKINFPLLHNHITRLQRNFEKDISDVDSKVKDLGAKIDVESQQATKAFSDLNDKLDALVKAFSDSVQLTQAFDTKVSEQLDAIQKDQQNQDLLLQQILTAEPTIPVAKTASVEMTLVFPDGSIILNQGQQMPKIKDTQSISFSIANPKDAAGQPSAIDPTKTVVNTSDPAIASVSLNPDGLSGSIKGATVGTVQITGSVTDANNPDDVVPFNTASIDVTAGDTVSVDLTFGEPTDNVPTPTPTPEPIPDAPAGRRR